MLPDTTDHTSFFSFYDVMEKSAVVEIALIDGAGRMVKLLLKDKAEEGKNLFPFNKGVLSNGIYFLQVICENTILANEKIVIE
jgi:hypothetical protein